MTKANLENWASSKDAADANATSGHVPTADGSGGVSWEAQAGGSGSYVPYIQDTAAETGTFTAVIGETHVVDTSAPASFDANLPPIANGQGRISFYFSGTGGQLTLEPNLSETIEGKPNIKLAQGHNTIENDGTEWKLIQRSGKKPERLDPAQITADQNNYNPTDWGQDVTHLYLDSDASRTITGIEENGFTDMSEVIIVNDGSNDIVFAHDSASSTVNNRILIDGETNFTLGANQVCRLLRDGGVANKWRLYAVNAGGGGGVTDHGALTGLGDDDHTQYSLADGTRAFTGTVSGITPTLAAHLATKGYADSLSVGHFSNVNWVTFGANAITFSATPGLTKVTDDTGSYVMDPSSNVNVTAGPTPPTGVGGIDDGVAQQANTWYYVWVISNGTNDAGMFSTSATSPTMPGGYIYKRIVGAVRSNGSSFFNGTFQTNDTQFTTLISIYGPAQPTSITTISLATVVPTAIAKESRLLYTSTDNEGPGLAFLDLYPSNSVSYGRVWNGTDDNGTGATGKRMWMHTDMPNWDGNVYIDSSAVGNDPELAQVWSSGWKVNL